jgi:hypothetical protein
LFDFQHLELSFSLSSREFMLSLQSGQVCFGSSFLGGGGFGFLDSLCGKELLFHSFSFKFLSGFFLL